MSFVQKPWLGVGSLLLNAVLLSSFSIVARGVGFSLPVLFVEALRELLGAAFLFTLLGLGKKFRRVSGKDWPWLILRSTLGVAGFIGAYYSVNYLPVGTTYFILFGSMTVASFILGNILFKERLTKITGFSLLLALVGLWLIYSVEIEASLLNPVCLAGSDGWGRGGHLEFIC